MPSSAVWLPGPDRRLGLEFMNTPALPPFDYKPLPYTGPSYDEVLNLRKTYLTPSLVTYHKRPVLVVEGKMQYVFDETGKRYLDSFGGILTISVGHCHPGVTKAINEQNAILQHATTIYLHPNVGQYAKALTDTMPGDLKVCYFVNSGSEANDLALLMARAYTGNYEAISLRNCYHGGGAATMALTSHSTWKYPVPLGFGVQFAQTPDTYRGPYGRNDPDAGKKYAADIQNLVEFGTCGKVAAFFAESIQGVGGFVVFPDGYLKEAYRIVRAAGGVCIADEVQAGFGRTGEKFWGFETQGVVPDIVTMAKGIGNGCALAAVVTTAKIASALTSRIHFNTFGGNPVVMAQGKAVLETIQKEGLQANSLKMGRLIVEGVEKLKQKHALIGDVRGKGLMLGIELVKSAEGKEPAKAETQDVLEHCKDMGLLLGKGGLHGNVIRVTPPMCINEADVKFILAVLDEALNRVGGGA